MEDWLAAGSLSDEEFDQLVRLTARYFLFNVDQFDHWKMPAPEEKHFYVDFSWQTLYPDPDVYRPVWPALSDGLPGWTLWRRDPDGTEIEVARYASKEAADLFRVAAERESHRRHDRCVYVVTPPERVQAQA